MNKSNQIIAFGFTILTAMPLVFVNIGINPIYLWDESRLAFNSFEMLSSSNWFIPTFEGKYELWNTKPPLVIWFQAISMKFLGISEFAIRLPSALFGIFTLLIITIFLLYQKHSVLEILLTTTLLLSCSGYNGWHCLRSGDYEAILIFFLTAQLLLFYWYLQETTITQRNKYWNLFLIVIVLAVWTKGINGLLFTPLFLMWWIVLKQYRFHRFSPFAIKLLLCLIGVVSYYGIRELMDPGYIHWVNENELAGRYLKTIDQKNRPFWFYWDVLGKQFFPHINVIMLVAIPGFIRFAANNTKTWLYLVSAFAFFFVIISLSQTKTLWYSVPLLPIGVIVLSISVIHTLELIAHIFNNHLIIQRNIKAVTILVAVTYFFSNTISEIHNSGKPVNSTEVTYFLKRSWDNKDVFDVHMYSSSYRANDWWYLRQWHNEGAITSYSTKVHDLPTSIPVISHLNDLNEVKSNYSIQIIRIINQQCILFQVKDQY